MSAGRATPCRGFTLVELVLAVGLFSILLLALLRLVDTSLGIWGRADESRELGELGGAVLELVASDLRALEAGKRGDLVADWRKFDLDGDGIEGTPGQRLRLVRTLGAAGLQRLGAGTPGQALETFERGWVEVAWAWLPPSGVGRDERTLGTLVRGERRVGEADTLSFFDASFFGAGGKPVPGSVDEIAGGVLWFDLWFATQTTVLRDGWELGDELRHASASFDAWNRARPNPEHTYLNQAPPGMPRAKDVPLLPRRVRVELELERPRDLRLRTRLAAPLGVEETSFLVRDGRRLPAPGAHVLLDDEWMRVVSVSENRATVERAQRGTGRMAHAADALVHHGWRAVREIPVDVTREDWDL
jgi:prepilin-type N-terminal cleavage/methylation domain-containing protein